MNAFAIYHDGIAPAHRVVEGARDAELITPCDQRAPCGLRNRRFDHHIASIEVQLRETRRFEGGLNIEAEIDQVRNELRVRLSLIKSAHDSESDLHVVFFHETGNQRCSWPLVRADCIRLARLEVE